MQRRRHQVQKPTKATDTPPALPAKPPNTSDLTVFPSLGSPTVPSTAGPSYVEVRRPRVVPSPSRQWSPKRGSSSLGRQNSSSLSRSFDSLSSETPLPVFNSMRKFRTPLSSSSSSLRSSIEEEDTEFVEPTLPITFDNQFDRKGTKDYMGSKMIERVSAILDIPISIDNKKANYPGPLQTSKGVVYYGQPFPTIVTTRKHVLRRIRDWLVENKIVHHFYLFGGAAAHVLNEDNNYSDVDILVDLKVTSEHRQDVFRRIEQGMTRVLKSFLPREFQVMGAEQIVEATYYSKKSLIRDSSGTPSWSLFTLYCGNGKETDIRFNATFEKRSWQFYGDSLRFRLDVFLQDSYTVDEIKKEPGVFSTSGRIKLALDMARNRLILTDDPMLIYGGGLLKYASNVLQNMQDAKKVPKGLVPMEQLHVKMIEKFYTDFNKPGEIEEQVRNFLITHSGVTGKGEDNFLKNLCGIIMHNLNAIRLEQYIIFQFENVKDMFSEKSAQNSVGS